MQFYYRATYASAVYVVIVYLSISVCLSVTSRHCTKKLNKRACKTPYDSQGTSFLSPKISAKFQLSRLLRGAK